MTLPCVILAGGLGTRISQFWSEGPKALVPVCGRPFADWQLAWLAAEGIRHVIYSVGHKAGLIQEFVGDGSRWGLSVDYVDEGQARLGTGGALRVALDRGTLPAAFLVLNGDSYLSCSCDEVEAAWQGSGRSALMTVFRNDNRWDQSNVVYRDGVVVCYDKAPPERLREEMHWIDYGLSILHRDVVSREVDPGVPADLATVMRDLARRGELAGFEVGERFFEVGTPGGVRDIEQHLSGVAR